MAWGSQTGQSTAVQKERGKGAKDNGLLENGPSSTCSSYASLPVPPDGGYGWVVCFGSFFCMLILDGMLFSFGVFFVELLDSFGESKGKTAWVGSTLMGTHLIVGPITACLVNMWDCRRVALLGSVIATVAFASCTVSPNLDVLILLYGVIAGIGVSMIYIPAILSVGFYFEKRRALANGIANSGSGLGTFIYAPLSRVLLDEYSWRGATLILSGLVFNCAVCACLFRPLTTSTGSTWKLPDDSYGDETDEESHPDGSNRLIKSKSHGDLPTISRGPTGQSQGRLDMASPKRPVNKALHSVYLSSRSLKIPSLDGSTEKLKPGVTKRFYVSSDMLESPTTRKDAFYSGSIQRLAPYQDPDVPYRVSMLRLPIVNDDDDSTSETMKKPGVRDVLKDMLGLGLFKSPLFITVMLSGVLWTTHNSILSILPDYAVLCGVNRSQAAMLVSGIGITNIAGRLGAGFLADRPEVDPVWVNTTALLIGSLTTLAIPFTRIFPLLALEAAIFGLCMGAWTSLRPILLVELLGLDRLTNAFGLMVMFQGIAFTIGSPITGTLYDITKSYTVPFIVGAVAFFISGILSLFMRRIASCDPHHLLLEQEVDIVSADVAMR